MLKKVFLGWEKSFTSSLVELTLSTIKSSKNATVVMPSLAACAELNAEFLNLSENSIKILSLNQFLTSLTKDKIANTSIKNLSWRIALQKADTEKLKSIFPGEYAFNNPNFFSIASILNLISEKIYTADKTFADLAQEINEKKLDRPELWQYLSIVSEDYLQILNLCDYRDPFHALISTENFSIANSPIIFASCHNLTIQSSRIIQSIAKKNEIILAINSAREFEQGFNESGALVSDYWENIKTTIPANAIHFCNSPEIEVEKTLVGCNSSNKISIISLDTSIIDLLDSRLTSYNLNFENKFSQKITRNKLINLIYLILGYCTEYSSKNLSRLVREPAMRKFFKSDSTELIGDLNNLISRYFPQQIELNCPVLAKKLPQHAEKLKLLSDILDSFKKAVSIESAITALINGLGLEPNEEDSKCLSILLENAAKIDALDLSSKDKPLDILLELMQSLSFNNAALNSTIKLLPAAEATVSTAQEFILLGASDENLPAKEANLPLLSSQISKVLKITDYSIANAAYLVAFLAKNKSKLTVFCSRQTIQAEPLTPSRFLFKTNFEDCAKRILEFTNQAQTETYKTSAVSNLKLKLPEPIATKIDRISASAFKDYIACPYLFYLKHILKLESSTSREQEMGASIFGHLAHKIIENFSRQIKGGESATEQVFDSACKQIFSEYFPWEVYPAVKLQLEQLKYRIQGVINLQKTLSNDGWEISEIELPFEDRLEGLAVKIKGKIDRVDINKNQNIVRIIDFKTSDKTNDFAHIDQEQGWIDLQLPLYANWIRKKHPTMSIEVAYVNLPKQRQSHSINSKALEHNEIQAAMDQVRTIAADILDNKFSDARPENWPYEFRSLFA